MKITSENYEEIMFLLAEEQFPEKEKQELLSEINADPFLSSEWGKWKATRMEDPLALYQNDAEIWSASFLRKRNRKRTGLRIILPAITSAAAILLIFILMKMVFRSSVPAPDQHSTEKAWINKVLSTEKTSVTAIKSPDPVRFHLPVASPDHIKTGSQLITSRQKDTLFRLTPVTTMIHLDLAGFQIKTFDNYRITITENLPVELVKAGNPVNFGDLMTDTHIVLVSNGEHHYPAIRISGANHAALTLNLKKVNEE